MVDSISGNALMGIQRARAGMQKNASDIARANTSLKKDQGVDVTRSLVELNQNKNASMASMKVFKSANDMLGALLDVKA